MVDVGEPAPDFTVPSHTNKDVSLSQFQGDKNFVLSFHISSFTSG